MSMLSHFVFDPVRAALARGSTSHNSVIAAASVAGQGAYVAATDAIALTVAQPLTANSAAALNSVLIKDVEDAIRIALDGIITASLVGVPIAGPAVTKEAIALANMSLAFAEQHALTYVSSLFAHGRNQVPA